MDEKKFSGFQQYKAVREANRMRTIFQDRVLSQLKKGYCPIVLVVGRQRTGKTAWALKMAYDIQEERKKFDKKATSFDINKDMFFKIDDFLLKMDEGEHKCYVMDEAGVSLDPYDYMAIEQKVFKHLIQSQAYKLNMLILIVPFAVDVAKTHRKNCDIMIKMHTRGCYTHFQVDKKHEDLSERPPNVFLIETVAGVPLPPKDIWTVYLEEFQAVYKQNILETQKDIMAMKRKKQSGGNRMIFANAYV